jgi:hypothetical protein
MSNQKTNINYSPPTALTELSPFERSEQAAREFAETMATSFVMLGYPLVMEGLERDCLNAIMSANLQEMAELVKLQDDLNRQVFLHSFEA